MSSQYKASGKSKKLKLLRGKAPVSRKKSSNKKSKK